MSFPDRYLDVHNSPKGPGDHRPTALDIIKDEKREGAFAGKVAFITGGSQGIGIETVRAIHATGADVYFTVRSTSAGETVVKDVSSANSTTGKLVPLIVNLDDLSSVKAGAEAFLAQSSKLNLLINNAGVMATPYGKTKDGFETQFAVNYISHFYLFHLLKDALLAGSASSPDFASRVVNVTSIGHRGSSVRFDDFNFEKEGSYNPWLGYGQSKTAMIWHANYIDRVFGAADSRAPIHAWSLHPGGIWTNLQKYVPAEQIAQWKELVNINPIMKSTAQGASTTVFAAVGRDLEGLGGKYLSDCRVMEAYGGSGDLSDGDNGYATWAYSPEDEEKLWKVTLGLLGLTE